MPAAPLLFAIYATVVWTGPQRPIPCPDNIGKYERTLHRDLPPAVCWREFVMTQHNPLYGDNSYATNEEHRPIWFLSRSVCERYRTKLVHYWITRNEVPFAPRELVSTRCGNWYSDSIGFETSDEM